MSSVHFGHPRRTTRAPRPHGGAHVQIQGLVEQPIVSGIGRRLNRRRFLVLAYHGVSDADRFREQIAAVASHRRPVALAEVEEQLDAGRPLPDDGFLVTFDDGRRSVYERGLPVLRDLGVPAVLFVVAGLIGTDQPFWWDEVVARSTAGGTTDVAPGTGEDLVRNLKRVPDVDRRRALEDLRAAIPSVAVSYPHLTADELVELERSGVAIGSHSLTHPCLDRCADAVLAEELSGARSRLEDLLDHPVRAIAYPNGNLDERVAEAAAAAGHRVAFAYDHRLSRLDPDPLGISRVRVDPSDARSRFDSVVAGVHPALHHARGRS